MRKNSSHKHAFVECATIKKSYNVGAHKNLPAICHKGERTRRKTWKIVIYVNFKSLMQMSHRRESNAFIEKKTVETKDEQLKRKKILTSR